MLQIHSKRKDNLGLTSFGIALGVSGASTTGALTSISLLACAYSLYVHLEALGSHQRNTALQTTVGMGTRMTPHIDQSSQAPLFIYKVFSALHKPLSIRAIQSVTLVQGF